MLATKALTSMRHAKRYTNIKKRGAFLVACCTLLSTLLPAQSRVDSLVQEIDKLEEEYHHEVKKLWATIEYKSGLPGTRPDPEVEGVDDFVLEERMEAYLDSVFEINVLIKGNRIIDDGMPYYPLAGWAANHMSGASGWYLVSIMLERFEKRAENGYCNLDFDFLASQLMMSWGFRSYIDLRIIIEQLAEVSRGSRNECLIGFIQFLNGY